jgi:hypothetical protein
MKVLSWDVGIINLAFCLIDYNKETKEFKILDWDIINLTDRDKMKCTECNANPSYYQTFSEKYYCKNHSKLAMITPPTFETLFTLCINNTCSVEGKNGTCGKKSKYSKNEINSENYNYCNTHAKSKYTNISNGFKLVSHAKKGIDKMSMDDFLMRLIVELDKRPNLLNCEYVFIENQPTMKNPRMKTISVTLYNYYLIRGIIDKSISKSQLKEVHFMAPSNKLKLANDGDKVELVKVKNNEDDSKTYKLTKSLGVKYCLEMIKQYPEWVTVFNSHKKKDDLADCFLQGMYALINKL